MSKKYRIHEFAERVGRSPSTIRRWEREGKISPKRHPSGHRYFDESDVRHLLVGGRPMKRKVVVYCRVSSAGQMVEDLMTIVHTFSCRLYGLRKYKTKLKEDFPATKPVRPETVE